MLVGYFLSTFPLDLETYSFLILFIDGIGRDFHLINSSYKRGGDGDRVITNENGMISDTRQGNIVLEVRVKLSKGWKIDNLSILLQRGHLLGE